MEIYTLKAEEMSDMCDVIRHSLHSIAILLSAERRERYGRVYFPGFWATNATPFSMFWGGVSTASNLKTKRGKERGIGKGD